MIRVGLLGAGYMGQTHASIYSFLPNTKLVAVADLRKENADKAAGNAGAKSYYSFEDMIKNEELDLIDICLPTYLHCEYTVKALSAGKHVLCEKPMAISVEEADRMIEAANKSGTKFMIGHCLRFWPEYIKLKELIDNGVLGKILNACFWRVSPLPTWSWEGWLMNPKKSGGAILDLHIHDVDYIAYLFGMPKRVCSVGNSDERGWNHVYTSYYYDDLACTSEGGWDMAGNYPFTAAFRVVGDKAACELRLGSGLMVYPQDGEAYQADVPRASLESGETIGNISDLAGYFTEIQYFTKCIEKGEFPTVVTPQDARNSVKITLAEQESLETKQIVVLDDK